MPAQQIGYGGMASGACQGGIQAQARPGLMRMVHWQAACLVPVPATAGCHVGGRLSVRHVHHKSCGMYPELDAQPCMHPAASSHALLPEPRAAWPRPCCSCPCLLVSLLRDHRNRFRTATLPQEYAGSGNPTHPNAKSHVKKYGSKRSN